MAMVFQWSGKTVRGTIESGEMTATTREEVIALLRKKNITATVVTEKTKKGIFGKFHPRGKGER